MKFHKIVEPAKGQNLSPTSPEFGYFINEHGETEFGKVGVIDDVANIQRYKDSCDYTILKKYLYGSEVPFNGLYGERPAQFSDPNDYAIFKEKLESIYRSLPNEVTSKYGSFMEFINECNSEDFKTLSLNPNVSNDNNGGSENVEK